MNGRCVKKDIKEFFDDGVKSLANQTTTGQLIGSLSQNLTCDGEQFTTPFLTKDRDLAGYNFVQFKTRDISTYTSHYIMQLLVTESNLEILKRYVNTTDTESIQCTSESTGACWENWEYELDYIYWYDVY